MVTWVPPKLHLESPKFVYCFFVFGTKDDHVIMSYKVVHDVLTNRKQKSLENVVIHIMALSLSTCLHSLVCQTYYIKQSILSNNHFF